jgi:hypothetical protein
MLEEAKRRDHRKIGAEMGLFAMDPEYVGPGMPLWLPKGTVLVEELEKLAKETEFAAGYVRVRTPHLAKEKMYKTSGHLPYYAESMFPPMELTKLDPIRTVGLKQVLPSFRAKSRRRPRSWKRRSLSESLERKSKHMRWSSWRRESRRLESETTKRYEDARASATTSKP